MRRAAQFLGGHRPSGAARTVVIPTALTNRKRSDCLLLPCSSAKFHQVARAERVRPSLKNYFFFLAFAFLTFFAVLAFFAFFAIASSYVG